MTFTDTSVLADYTPVTFDLYANIHKAIRSDLFDVVLHAGRVDPAARRERIAVAARVGQVVDVLVSHAEHEDDGLAAILAEHVPEMGSRIADEHARIDTRLVALRELADDAVRATDHSRRSMHRLYLELASFTGDYLAHQDYEERIVMPAVEQAIGVEAVLGVHQHIVGSIAPAEMASSLAVMLPVLNVDDRTELLGGMRASAPAEVFAGVWGLAGSVLSHGDFADLAARLGITVV